MTAAITRHAAVLAFVFVLLVALGACSGDDEAATETISSADAIEETAPKQLGTNPTATPRPVATLIPTPTPLPTIPPPTLIPTATPQPERTEPAIRPPGDWDVWVLTSKTTTAHVETYDKPNGTPFQLEYEYLNGNTIAYPLLNPTFYGNELVLMVVEGEPGDEWVKIQAPVRPQGTTAWVKSELFEWSESDYFIEIDVTTNTVRAWNGDELLTETKAVTGSSRTPTPLFTGYIDEKVPDQGAAFGPWVLTLATFSESHNTFGSSGGLPKIALHGTNNPGIIGQYASNGCIRVPNDIIQYLAETVPLGTRVEIVRS